MAAPFPLVVGGGTLARSRLGTHASMVTMTQRFGLPALAIVSALRYRDRTGEGQHLDIALLDVYYHYHEVNVHAYSGSDGAVKPTRAGRHMTYV